MVFVLNPPEPVWEVISDTTLAAAAASIDVQNISTDYYFFKVIAHLKVTEGCNVNLTLNGDTNGNYTDGYFGTNYVVAAFANNAAATAWKVAGFGDASDIAPVALEIVNQEAGKTSAHCFWRNTATQYWQAQRYAGAALVSRLTFTPSAGNLAAGTRITILGVK